MSDEGKQRKLSTRLWDFYSNDNILGAEYKVAPPAQQRLRKEIEAIEAQLGTAQARANELEQENRRLRQELEAMAEASEPPPDTGEEKTCDACGRVVYGQQYWYQDGTTEPWGKSMKLCRNCYAQVTRDPEGPPQEKLSVKIGNLLTGFTDDAIADELRDWIAQAEAYEAAQAPAGDDNEALPPADAENDAQIAAQEHASAAKHGMRLSMAIGLWENQELGYGHVAVKKDEVANIGAEVAELELAFLEAKERIVTLTRDVAALKAEKDVQAEAYEARAEAAMASETTINWRDLQADVATWTRNNFRLPHLPYRALLGAMEQLGELCHAHLSEEQDIRQNEGYGMNAQSAIGDIIFYLADYCNQRGWNIGELVTATWAQVKECDWTAETGAGEEADNHAR